MAHFALEVATARVHGLGSHNIARLDAFEHGVRVGEGPEVRGRDDLMSFGGERRW